MLQTDRKTDQNRQTGQDREQTRQQKQSHEQRTNAALALEAILAGSWDQLPADGVLALSRTMGNGALTDLFSMRSTGPETQMRAMPRGSCETAPIDMPGGMPMLADTPVFGAMSPMGAAAPMEL